MTVFPFATRGDGPIDYLREGMMGLLSIKLDDDGRRLGTADSLAESHDPLLVSVHALAIQLIEGWLLEARSHPKYSCSRSRPIPMRGCGRFPC